MKFTPRWPIYGYIISLGKFLSFEQSPWYVDFPYAFFLMRLSNFDQEMQSKNAGKCVLQKYRKELLKIVENANNEFSKTMFEDVSQEKFDPADLNFMRLRMSEKKRNDKKLKLSFELDWEKFVKFTTNFAALEIPIWRKYEYLRLCQTNISGVSYKHFSSNTVYYSVKRDSYSFRQSSFNTINKIRSKLTPFEAPTKGDEFEYVTSFLVPHIQSFLDLLTIHVSYGFVTSCYREMRHFLENLYFTYLEDLLWIRSSMATMRDHYMSTVLSFSGQWFETLKRQENMGRIEEKYVFSLKNLRKAIEKLIPAEQYTNSKKAKIVKLISRKVTMPILLTMLSIEENDVPDVLKGQVIDFDRNNFKSHAKQDLDDILELIQLPDVEKKVITEAFTKILKELTKGISPIPSPTGLGQLVSFITSWQDMSVIYDDYSFFTHTYSANWELYPNQSVFTQMLLSLELERMSTLLDLIL